MKEAIENCKCSKRTPVFVIGVVFTLVQIILYAVGVFSDMRMGLWIASIVLGALSAVMMFISAHSNSGWIRMFSTAMLVVNAVFITIIATVCLS